MNDYRQDNTLAIVSLVLGGLGFLISIIPCIGFFSVPLGLIGMILGAIAYFKAKDNGDKKVLSIVALVVSFLPLLISALWYFTFSSSLSGLERDFSDTQSCDTLKTEIERINFVTDSLQTELDKDEAGASVFGSMSTLTSLSIDMVKLQEQADILGCDFARAEEGIIDVEKETIKFDSLTKEDVGN